MIDVIATLKKLNKEFPRFQVDTLLKIVDCIQEQTNKEYDGAVFTPRKSGEKTSSNARLVIGGNVKDDYEDYGGTPQTWSNILTKLISE